MPLAAGIDYFGTFAYFVSKRVFRRSETRREKGQSGVSQSPVRFRSPPNEKMVTNHGNEKPPSVCEGVVRVAQALQGQDVLIHLGPYCEEEPPSQNIECRPPKRPRRLTTRGTEGPHPQDTEAREETEVNGLVGVEGRLDGGKRRRGDGAGRNNTNRPEEGQPSIVACRKGGKKAHWDRRLQRGGTAGRDVRRADRERWLFMRRLPQPGPDPITRGSRQFVY